MKQIELKYSFDALEPYIDRLTMETHYGKHHAGYTNNLNKAIEDNKCLQGKTIEEILKSVNELEPSIRDNVRNNGGGYYNHNLYFDILSPNPKKAPEGVLLEKINETFGSLEELQNQLTQAALGQFGSGWAWLVKDENKNLKIVKTPNQDNPLTNGYTPILGIDVWEHAYYLKYKNVRKDYVDNFFKVLDWQKVEALY